MFWRESGQVEDKLKVFVSVAVNIDSGTAFPVGLVGLALAGNGLVLVQFVNGEEVSEQLLISAGMETS